MYQYLQVARIESVSKNNFGNFWQFENFILLTFSTDNVRCLIVSRRQRRTVELAPCMESAQVD